MVLLIPLMLDYLHALCILLFEIIGHQILTRNGL